MDLITGSRAPTLGVVVAHKPGRPITELPAVRDLVAQVDELLIIRNGLDGQIQTTDRSFDVGIQSLTFPTNRGTAAAWNTALAWAADGEYRYLYILDQDSIPSPEAVDMARAQMTADGVAAVVQPPSRDAFRLVSFPWNTVASGSIYRVEALRSLGGFDERLFVDEVDHEMLARLIGSGYEVRSLPFPTISHQVGSPRAVRIWGRDAWTLGHSVERNRLRGFSTGLLVRRYMLRAPAISVRLLSREALITVKDLAGCELISLGARLRGVLRGVATSRPPLKAAEQGCPYCGGPLLGRFGAVPDWLFATGAPSDVYDCARCGALAAGTVPERDEVASWYSDYYTHTAQPDRARVWSRFWPTPRRRRELEQFRWYFTPAGSAGRFLEVGTGSGERLVQFADAGWKVVGQDPDPGAGQLARDRGIQVHNCAVTDLVGLEGPFEVIGLNHVLEHAPDPAELLEACAALLAPNGRLCVICPNACALGRRLFGRWWYGLDQPRHLAIPTLESLERLTTPLGLKAVHVFSASTNASVFLGGSLDRGINKHLRPGRLRRSAEFSAHLFGQAMGRAAVLLNRGLGEEVVWVGQRSEP